MVQLSPQQKIELLHQHADGVPWTRLSRHSGVSVRTLQRWDKQGAAGSLGRKPRRDKGTLRTDRELVQIIEALCLRAPAPSYAYIHRRVSDIAHDRGLHAPGYTTIRSVARNIDPGLLALATGGDREYRDKFELVYRRTTQAPNEQWQMDHTLLDVMILDEQQRPIRPWLSIVLDDYSRAIAGYSLSTKAPSAQQSALALHQAISRKGNPLWVIYGLPNVLYTDHGTDFTSSRIDELCLALHMQLIHSRVAIPQGRGKIERFYRTITTELLPHLPGYIPHGTSGQPINQPALNLHQFDAIMERFIVHEYNERAHSSTGETPHARWKAQGFIPRNTEHPEDIDLLLLTATAHRRVQRDGIRFASTRYISPVLAAYVGEEVTVRYDPRDLGEIRLYFNNEFLCRAIAPERAPMAITFEELRQARNQQRRSLKRQLKEYEEIRRTIPPDPRYLPEESTTPSVEDPTPAPSSQRHGLKTYASDE